MSTGPRFSSVWPCASRTPSVVAQLPFAAYLCGTQWDALSKLMTLGHSCPLSSSPRQVWKSPTWAQVCGGWKHCPDNVSGPPPSPGLLQSLGLPDPHPGWWRRRRRAPHRPGWGDHLLQEQCLRAPARGAAGAGGTPPR